MQGARGGRRGLRSEQLHWSAALQTSSCQLLSSGLPAQCSKHKPDVAQLVEHLTPELCRDQMVLGSTPGGRTFSVGCSPMQNLVL